MSLIFSERCGLKTSARKGVSLYLKKYVPHKIASAPAKTAPVFANLCHLAPPGPLRDDRRDSHTPISATLNHTTGAECFTARSRPRNAEQAARSVQHQSRKALEARTTAMAVKSATGRSVITTGQCAAIVGSITRKSSAPKATVALNTRSSANAKPIKSTPLNANIATRALRCTESGSFF